MMIGENQEMKNQDLKKFKSSSFQVKSSCAISLLMAKLEVVNAELALKLGRNVLIHTCARVKTVESIQAKCRKKGYEPTFETAMEKINDIVGV
ncbi:MAG: GTP pyrophosphokinase, partial [Lachnospiraceae bacterium]|nr:GTP pyrophosphokinase [Lachnospiraceae bacterium]